MSFLSRYPQQLLSLQAASAYDAAARKIRGNSTKFNLQERDVSDVLLQTAAKSALEQLDKSRTERNVWADTTAPTAPDEGRHAKLLQELLAENNGNVRPAGAPACFHCPCRGLTSSYTKNCRPSLCMIRVAAQAEQIIM